MNRCETCAAWDTRGLMLDELIGTTGKCTAIPQRHEATRWNDDCELELVTEHATATAWTADGSSYYSALYTKPEHGCTMWRGKA